MAGAPLPAAFDGDSPDQRRGADRERRTRRSRLHGQPGLQRGRRLDPRRGLPRLARALPPRFPPTTAALVTPQPYRVFGQVLALLFPSAMRPGSSFGAAGVSPGSFVHPAARLEHGVTVDPGAVIGPKAEIGAGTIVAAQSVIGPQVRIGRDCSIGPGVTVSHAFIGNRVILHPGVRIGQDGFGFDIGPKGHLKVPQIGRVIIQDDVEIGANTTIDRGRKPRHDHRRGHQDRQPRADRPQRGDRPSLRDRRPGRPLRLDDAGGFRRPGRPGRHRRACQDRQGRPDRRPQRRHA